MERKHNAPLHRGVIDGIRQVINQMQQKKSRMGVRRGRGGGLFRGFPEMPGCRERDVSGM